MRSVFVRALLICFNCDILQKSLIFLLPSHNLQTECSKLYKMHMAKIDIIMSFLAECFFVDLSGNFIELLAGFKVIAVFYVCCVCLNGKSFSRNAPSVIVLDLFLK